MAQSRKADERYLDKDERELSDRARQPALREMKKDDLTDLAKRLRERRNRARDLARDQRRSARRGGKQTEGETGSDRKKALLSAAMKRVNRELDRRRAGDRGKAATANRPPMPIGPTISPKAMVATMSRPAAAIIPTIPRILP